MTTPNTLQERTATLRVNLVGGIDRLRQLLLYVAWRCQDAEYFGIVKLNKIIWRADFEAFARRGVPVSGREYRKLEFGPAPKEMPNLQREMLMQGHIRFENRVHPDGREERRVVAVAQPDQSLFSAEDVAFVEEAIAYYWDRTGTEASEDSHRAAWSSRNLGEPMPYELALLADRPLSNRQFLKLRAFVEDEDVFSQ